jgi:putative nucleotidyltransferase with HDIG domain
MDALVSFRVLWAAPEAAPRGFAPGPFLLDCLVNGDPVADAVAAAEAAGGPYSVVFLPWTDAVSGGMRGLVAGGRGPLLVIDQPATDRPRFADLPAELAPERCVLVNSPLPPFLRTSLAVHLGTLGCQKQGRVVAARVPRRKHPQERLQALYGIVEKIHSADDLADAVQAMVRLLGARTGSLLLLDGTEELYVAEAAGPNRKHILGRRVPLAQSRVSRYALERHEPVLVADMGGDPRFRESRQGIRFRARSVLSVPLFTRDLPLGVLNFGASSDHRSFTTVDRDLVVALGRQVTAAVEKHRLVEELRQAVDQSTQALVGAIEAKDPCTRGHSDRVRHYARMVAAGMGLVEGEVGRLVRAAVLHDVGKIGVPEAVLNKPDRLTDAEHRAIQRHPEVGVEIVREIRGMEETLELIHAHHERFDGGGYPRGLQGHAIPVGARILAVADAFDAMTSDRPYRSGLSRAIACEEVAACAGTQFDPDVARLFLDGLDRWPYPDAVAC